MVNPGSRTIVEKEIGEHSLLAISPVNELASLFWREALFRVALRTGPGYIETIGQKAKKCPFIPDWFVQHEETVVKLVH